MPAAAAIAAGIRPPAPMQHGSQPSSAAHRRPPPWPWLTVTGDAVAEGVPAGEGRAPLAAPLVARQAARRALQVGGREGGSWRRSVGAGWTPPGAVMGPALLRARPGQLPTVTHAPPRRRKPSAQAEQSPRRLQARQPLLFGCASHCGRRGQGTQRPSAPGSHSSQRCSTPGSSQPAAHGRALVVLIEVDGRWCLGGLLAAPAPAQRLALRAQRVGALWQREAQGMGVGAERKSSASQACAHGRRACKAAAAMRTAQRRCRRPRHTSRQPPASSNPSPLRQRTQVRPFSWQSRQRCESHCTCRACMRGRAAVHARAAGCVWWRGGPAYRTSSSQQLETTPAVGGAQPPGQLQQCGSGRTKAAASSALQHVRLALVTAAPSGAPARQKGECGRASGQLPPRRRRWRRSTGIDGGRVSWPQQAAPPARNAAAPRKLSGHCTHRALPPRSCTRPAERARAGGCCATALRAARSGGRPSRLSACRREGGVLGHNAARWTGRRT